MATAGYSGTPLAKKLGIKSGHKMRVLNAPKPYADFFEELPEEVELVTDPNVEVDFIHLFATTVEQLESAMGLAKPTLKMNGSLWVSWPKKTSGIHSEIDKFFVMACGQRAGLVDTKVAAIDEQWSGHKFMYRVKDRK